MEENFKLKWQKCLDIIRDNVGQAHYDIWFSCAQALKFEDDHLTISVPSQYYFEVYEDKFFDVLSRALKRVFGPEIRLDYDIAVVKGDAGSKVNLTATNYSHAIGSKLAQSYQKPEAMARHTQARGSEIDSQLNKSLTFENYCLGDSNRLAYTIAESIANNPHNVNFNPFFLYGPVGIGKTHLIQAIGIRVKEKNPEAKVLFTTARQFQHLYANAVIQKKIPSFINWFQQMDVLLLDDLQELSGKIKTTDDALFPIFNHLHQSGKQLVFTCDRPPMELDGIADRLIDRFKWGLTEKLDRPDFELRKKILTFKARKNGLTLPDDVINEIATLATASIRELEGVVMGILTRSIATNSPITVEMAREVMKNSVANMVRKPINFEMIIEATADYYHLRPEVIFGKSRVRDVADARQVVMYLSRKLTDLSSSAIGFKLNRRHATVLHGISTVKDRLNVAKDLAEAVAAIEHELSH